MKNDTTRLVPKLRFPGFIGEWEIKKLGAITKWSSGGTPPKDNPRYWGGDIPWISAASMYGRIFDTSDRTLTEEGVKSGSKIAKKGSVLLLVRGSMLFNAIPVGVTRKDVAFNQDVKAIVGTGIEQDYLYYFFKASEHYLLSLVVGTGIGAGKLDTDQLQAMNIKLPKKTEQEKIAGFLTVVDERIAAMDKKIELLQQYKKGIMQKIFSQKLRFKDEKGQDYPAWQTKKLGEIAEVYQPVTISQSSLVSSGFPVYGANGIIGYYDKHNHENAQIAVTCRGNTCGTVNLTTPKAWITGNAMVINVDSHDEADRQFLYYALKYDDLNYLVTGSGQPQITGEIKKHKIQLPSVMEQQKIADLLSTFDAKIHLEKTKLEQVKLFKMSLLQRVFV